jgi:hypothetical protein
LAARVLFSQVRSALWVVCGRSFEFVGRITWLPFIILCNSEPKRRSFCSSASRSRQFLVVQTRRLDRMAETYAEPEELLDYEEEEEAAPDAVAAKTNGETVKK